jgi:hypothetical protein
MTDNLTASEDQQISGIYCDTQIQNKSGGAIYFLEFLGCDYTYDSKQQTKGAYETFRQKIEETAKTPTEKLGLIEKLNTFFTEDSDFVKPLDFIEKHIKNDKQKQLFKEACISNKIELNGFEKDNDFIQTKIKVVRVEFENGYVFSGDSETFPTDAIFTPNKEGGTDIKVNSKIKSV